MTSIDIDLDRSISRLKAFLESGKLPSGSEKVQSAWHRFSVFARKDIRALLDQHDADAKRIAELEAENNEMLVLLNAYDPLLVALGDIDIALPDTVIDSMVHLHTEYKAVRKARGE